MRQWRDHPIGLTSAGQFDDFDDHGGSGEGSQGPDGNNLTTPDSCKSVSGNTGISGDYKIDDPGRQWTSHCDGTNFLLDEMSRIGGVPGTTAIGDPEQSRSSGLSEEGDRNHYFQFENPVIGKVFQDPQWLTMNDQFQEVTEVTSPQCQFEPKDPVSRIPSQKKTKFQISGEAWTPKCEDLQDDNMLDLMSKWKKLRSSSSNSAGTSTHKIEGGGGRRMTLPSNHDDDTATRLWRLVLGKSGAVRHVAASHLFAQQQI